jgi:large subunit ribosomal protein L19
MAGLDELMNVVKEKYIKKDIPEFRVGDTVRVNVKICLLYTSPSPRD